MSDLMLMAPTNQTFSELFGNGVKYIIPRFQRDYAWELEQWEDLWQDIEALEEEGYHYMGYIVLQKTAEHVFEVIDGQQRLVTFSLVALAAMKRIQDCIDAGVEVDDNSARRHLLKERLIGSTNPVTLKVENKLALNRNNHRYFREICSKMRVLNERGVSKTNSLMDGAFAFFVSKIRGKNGGDIASLIERVASSMVFTKIVTQDNINAYKVFETLNARGVQLSTPDLLKNHIFSTLTGNDDVSAETLDVLDEDWATIIAQLGESNFTDYVRYHHNIGNRAVSTRGLFKSVKRLVNTPRAANDYLDALKEYAPVYSALLRPNDEWWRSWGNMRHRVVHYLEAFKLFQIKQSFPVLMVAIICDGFSNEEVVKLMHYFYVLLMRYSVICRLSPIALDQACNAISIKIVHGEFTRASHIKNSKEFRTLYPDDQIFRNAFEFYSMPSRQSPNKIRFLLTEIENGFGRELNYLDSKLEHVCPYHPNQAWCRSFGEGVDGIVDRLGNMVLLEKDDLGRADFAAKKQTYRRSSFRLANRVAEAESWDLTALNHYQSWLAEQAVKVWRLEWP